VAQTKVYRSVNVGRGMDSSQIERLHTQLVEQLRQNNLLDNASVDAAFSAVPRHLFLPNFPREQVYADDAIALKVGASGEVLSSSSQPTMMAIMLQQAGLQAGMNVLEIGTASGYNAAIMKHIVGQNGRVTSLEIDYDLAQEAEDHLVAAGFPDVRVVNIDAVNGYAPRAQYDRIVSTVGVWDVPANWIAQLKSNGRLVVPIWLDGVQVSATFIRQADGSYLSVDNRPCAFVYLQGLGAGPNVRKQVGSTSMMILSDEIGTIDTVSLHLLLSDDLEIHRLGKSLTPTQFWYGFQIYLMLNEPHKFVFAVYSIAKGGQAYGMQGSGIVLFAPASAAFANYDDGGKVFSFGGSDAYLEMLSQFKDWQNYPRPLTHDLRLRLIPKTDEPPEISSGKLYKRRDHYLHVWLDS
jgi:protein-L-isoaspartate(D-aspartate) O-methyltransferase